jgi:hypothetical protein
MRTNNTRREGVGNHTVHLADIPIEQRLRAVRLLERWDMVKSDTERATLLALALNPGCKGGRIAA